MTHYGSLETQPVSEDIPEIRGANVRGPDDTKLGKVDDVIFDHDAMKIRYVVVNSGGWMESATFLLPADRVSVDENHPSDLVASVNREQIVHSPLYDKKKLKSEDEWKKYEQEFKKYWDEEPVMHMKGSYRIITPPDEPTPGKASSAGSKSESAEGEINPANLFPDRISKVFSDPAPNPGNVTLRPKSVARAEEAAPGVATLKPRWWEAFENYLQINKDEIQGNCENCSSKAA